MLVQLFSDDMLPLDDLAGVASALARTDLDTLFITDRRHHSLVLSHFDGKGPLRFVNSARALNKELKISGFDDELTLSDIQEFYRSLRNCYVSSLRLHRHVIDPKELTKLRAVRNDYAVYGAHLRYVSQKYLNRTSVLSRGILESIDNILSTRKSFL